MLDKGNNINTQDLTDIGNAEDYFRVSNNLSCVLEMVLAVEKELKVN
jgi:hypothetical protein